MSDQSYRDSYETRIHYFLYHALYITNVPFFTFKLKLITLLSEGHEHYGNLHGQHVSIWYRIENERLRNFTDAKILFQRNLIKLLRSFSLFYAYSNTLSDLHLRPSQEPTLWSKSGIVTGIEEV